MTITDLQEFDEEWAKKIQLEKFRWHNSQWLEMVETRQVTEMGDPYMYPEEGYDPYLQDADILDRPDLFYDGKALLICSFIQYKKSQRFVKVYGFHPTSCVWYLWILVRGKKMHKLDEYHIYTIENLKIMRNLLCHFC